MKRDAILVGVMMILLAFSVLVGVATPASGALSVQDVSKPALDEAQDPNAEDRRRVLHLADGRVLRGRSKLVADHWSVRIDGKWSEFPATEVTRSRVERELLAEAAKLARDIEPDDLERRVIYADWLADQGLASEALDELDRVLRADPDHSGALTVIARRAFPLERARDREFTVELYKELILAGGPARPVERELILTLLERSVSKETIAQTFAHELTAFGNTRREFATLAYRRVLVGEQVPELLRRCALDGSTAVRAGAARALAATGEAGMTLPLIRALGSDSPAVRTNSAESLGVLATALGAPGTALAAPALVHRYSALAQGGGVTRPPAAHLLIGKQFAYVSDFDVEIAQGASIADPTVTVGDEGSLLDVRLGGISGWTTVREARALRGSLELVSGEKLGASASAWEAWLAE